MRKYNFLFLIILVFTFFTFSPNVKALEYISPTKFAGKSPNDIFWVNAGSTLFGDFYYETPIETKEDYLLVTYCASGSISAWTGAVNVQADGFKFDTNTWCSTGNYGGTIQQIYFPVNYWAYTDTIAYMEDTATFRNPNDFNVQVRLLNVTNSSSLDMSMAILAYIKSQQNGQDYNDVLEEIKQNQQDYNEEIGIVQDKLDETNASINDMKDALTDSSVSADTGSSFFEGFNTSDYGLSDIVTMPLELIRGLTSNTCVSLNLTLPFVNKTFSLPCMSSIYQQYFGDFYSLYQTITFGFISYWIIVRIFNLVKDFKNPDHDEIEVLDL